MLFHRMLMRLLILGLFVTPLPGSAQMTGPAGPSDDPTATIGPIAGTITALEKSAHTFRLGMNLFHVPESVASLDDLSVGSNIVFRYEQVGADRVITFLERAIETGEGD